MSNPNTSYTNLDLRYGGFDKEEAARLQSIYLGDATRKLRKGQTIKIVFRGDSTTYGHDVNSSDKVAPPLEPLPDGSYHSFTRSPKPFPAAFSDYLNQVYPSGVFVENQGYSGDWVQRGFTRWLNNVNANITIISYGINDASASYVPDQYRGNVAEYVSWHEKMILRDLSWGSAVVLMTPTRQLGSSGNTDTDTFRNVLNSLANKYGIPIIDGESLLQSAQRDAWSDGNHMTTKGNAIIGARLATAFIGEGIQSPKYVTSGSKLLARPTMSNLVMTSGVKIGNSNGYYGPYDDATTGGTAVELNAVDGYVYWSFYTDAPDMVLFPLDYINAQNGTNVYIEYLLDFGVEQGMDSNAKIIDASRAAGIIAGNTVTSGPYSGTTVNFNSDPKVTSTYIRISTQGFHTIRARLHRDGVGICIIQAIEFMSWRDWQTIKTMPGVTFDTKGNFSMGVPTAYNESNDILTTKINWPSVLTNIGISKWTTDYYLAPVIKLTIRSYAVGSIEYSFVCTQRADQAGSDLAAVSVGSTSTEGPSSITMVQELRVLSSGATSPKAHTSARELASIAYEASTQSLVFTWRTTNSSDGTTAKNMKKNFFMQFSLL